MINYFSLIDRDQDISEILLFFNSWCDNDKKNINYKFINIDQKMHLVLSDRFIYTVFLIFKCEVGNFCLKLKEIQQVTEI